MKDRIKIIIDNYLENNRGIQKKYIEKIILCFQRIEETIGIRFAETYQKKQHNPKRRNYLKPQ